MVNFRLHHPVLCNCCSNQMMQIWVLANKQQVTNSKESVNNEGIKSVLCYDRPFVRVAKSSNWRHDQFTHFDTGAFN